MFLGGGRTAQGSRQASRADPLKNTAIAGRGCPCAVLGRRLRLSVRRFGARVLSCPVWGCFLCCLAFLVFVLRAFRFFGSCLLRGLPRFVGRLVRGRRCGRCPVPRGCGGVVACCGVGGGCGGCLVAVLRPSFSAECSCGLGGRAFRWGCLLCVFCVFGVLVPSLCGSVFGSASAGGRFRRVLSVAALRGRPPLVSCGVFARRGVGRCRFGVGSRRRVCGLRRPAAACFLRCRCRGSAFVGLRGGGCGSFSRRLAVGCFAALFCRRRRAGRRCGSLRGALVCRGLLAAECSFAAAGFCPPSFLPRSVFAMQLIKQYGQDTYPFYVRFIFTTDNGLGYIQSYCRDRHHVAKLLTKYRQARRNIKQLLANDDYPIKAIMLIHGLHWLALRQWLLIEIKIPYSLTWWQGKFKRRHKISTFKPR